MYKITRIVPTTIKPHKRVSDTSQTSKLTPKNISPVRRIQLNRHTTDSPSPNSPIAKNKSPIDRAPTPSNPRATILKNSLRSLSPRGSRRVHFDANVSTTVRRRPASYSNADTKYHDPWIKIGNTSTVNKAFTSKTHTPTPTTAGQYAILDSGTTSNFVPESYLGNKPGPPPLLGGPDVECPNGTIMPTVGTDELNLHDLPEGARKCMKLKGLRVPLMSVKQLCSHGLNVNFSTNEVRVYNQEGAVVLEGQCGPNEGDLYLVPLNDTGKRINLCGSNNDAIREEAAKPRAWSAYDIRAVPALINYLHACAGFPEKRRWISCIKRNYYQGWPGLTVERVNKCCKKSTHFTFGRQRLINRGIRSTSDQSEPAPEDDPDCKREAKEEELPIKPIPRDESDPAKIWDTERPLGLGLPPIRNIQERSHDVGVFVTEDIESLFKKKNLTDEQKEDLKRMIATDQTGKFPVTSARGHNGLFVMYDYDSNYMNAIPIKGHKTKELMRAWDLCYEDLRRAGFYAILQRIDNEITNRMIDHIETNGINVEIAPPGNHRTNPAERAIQTLKHHMISIFSGMDPDFPMDQWDLLMPQIILTLNLQRESRYQPQLSAYAQIKGQFDFNATPLAPLGCAVIVHNRVKERGSWADHGTAGFYVGPALDHYRNYKCYIPEHRSTRVSDTVEFFPTCCDVPMLTATDLLSTALQELTVALEAPDRPITSIEDQVTLNNNIRHIQSLLNVPRVTPEDETKPGG